MSSAGRIAAFALFLSSAGCAPSSAPDPLGVAREGDGTRPLVGFPTDVAPAEPLPFPIPGVHLASRGHDYLAVWSEIDEEGVARVEGIRFGEDGAPASKAPFQIASSHDFAPFEIHGVACAPAGDCVVVWSGEAGPVGIRVSTLRADGSRASVSLPIDVPLPSPAQAAFDGDTGSFLVIWQGPDLRAIHFADGAQIEPTPIQIAPSGELDGAACAPGSGCLVLFSQDQTSSMGAIVTAAGASAPTEIADIRLTQPCYGDGVYFALGPGNTPGVVRLGLDGIPLDAMPIPIGNFNQKSKLLDGGPTFDGSAFVALMTAFDTQNNKRVNFVQRAVRIGADGLSATPAEVDLTALSLQGPIACGDTRCEIALSADATGTAALTTAAFHGSTVTTSADYLVRAPGSQDTPAAISLGGKVLIVWSEGPLLRSRWFDQTGRAVGPTRDVDERRHIVFTDSNDDAGLLVLEGPPLPRATRVVASDGTIGPAVTYEPPAKTSHEHARFGVLDGRFLAGSLRLFRFDAKGHALDAEPIVIPRPLTPLAGSAMGRAGDTFIVTHQGTAPYSIAEVVRVRDTGEILDVHQVLPNASILGAPGGVACSPAECAIIWTGSSSFGGNPSTEVWMARFSPTDANPMIKPDFAGRGHAAGVVFDGQSFLAAFTRKDDLGVARVGAGETKSGHGMMNGDVFAGMAAADGAALILTSNTVDLGPLSEMASRLHVRNVLDEGGGETGGGGSGGSGGGATESIVAGGGCGCELDARGDLGGWSIAVFASLAAARTRRRRGDGRHRPKR
jgi:hypothetical protein